MIDNFAPSLDDLVSNVYDERKGKKKNHNTAIFILTNKSNHFMDEMLGHLKKQTNQNFDIIMVYGPEDEKIKDNQGFNIVHVMRSRDVGPSGGFYLCEKFAMKEDYDVLIRSESDAMPTDPKLIESLQKNIENYDVVMPRSYDYSMALRERGVHRYTAFKMEMFRKRGISFFPFYFGGEDLELQLRMEKNSNLLLIDNFVNHPIRTPIVMNTFKHYYFTRNELIARCIHEGFFPFFIHSFKRVFFPMVFQKLTNDPNFDAYLNGTVDFLNLKMWIRKIENIKWGYFAQIDEKEVKAQIGIVKTSYQAPDNIKVLDESKISGEIVSFKRRRNKGVLNLISEYFGLASKIFNKSIMVNVMPLYDLMFYSLFAKEAVFLDGKTWYYKNFSIIDKIISIVSILLIPLALTASLLFTVYSKLIVYPKLNTLFLGFVKKSKE